MNPKLPTNRSFQRMLVSLLSISVILVIALPVIQLGFAVSSSPFLGQWQTTDVDRSHMSLVIAGPPRGPLQITWIEDRMSFCNQEAGIARGTASLDQSDPNLLDADLQLECLSTGESLRLHLVWRYHPLTKSIVGRYDNGVVIDWHRSRQSLPPSPELNLRVNYGDNWVEGFYEAGHMAWITVTGNDGVTVKARAKLVTEPKGYWEGATGFQSVDSVWFDADGNLMQSPPDIQPNDWVFGWLDNGSSARVQIGDIRGTIELAADTVQGTITAEWLTDPIQVECLDWGSGKEAFHNKNKDGGFVRTNGADSYSCSWAGEWDIQPHQNVGVGYFGADGHWIANAFAVRNPRIVASEAGDWFWTMDFNSGTLNLSIYQSENEEAALLWQGTQEVDEAGFVMIGRDVHEQDLASGNYLVVSDGVNKKGLVLESITVEVFDPENEIMAGTAPPGREAWAMAGPQNRQEPIKLQADPISGAWLADFKTIGFDITEDMRTWSHAQIFDEDGDANEGNAPPYLATITVTGTGDVVANDGICTLREAIIAANSDLPSGDQSGECPAGQNSQMDKVVLVAGNIYSLTIDRTSEDTVADGDLDILNNASVIDLVIKVAGDGKATISQDAVMVDDRVLENHEATIQIENVIITGGSTVGGGGGLLNNGTMSIISSLVSGNSVSWDGGGIYNSNLGTLSIDASTITGNTSSAFAGGIMNKGRLTLKNSEIRTNTDVNGGGGMNNEGTLTIDHSVLSANSSGQGGALYNSGTATITNETVVGGTTKEDGNTSDGGGGLFNVGTLIVEDSIVSHNWASYGGGLFNWTGGNLTISNSVVSNNSANQGGGLHNKENSRIVIQNGTIFSGNYAEWSGGGIDNWGTITITGSVLHDNLSSGEAGDAMTSGVFENSTASITASCIVGNGDIAVFTAMSIPVHATGNWWGDAGGPSGLGPGSGDSVSSNIDFSGWLTSPPSVCAP